MIGRKLRFHGRGSLTYVYKRGKSVRTNLLSLKFAPNQRRRNYRLAVVVSRKVSKSAVVRNRIRRRLYEAVRKLYDFPDVYDLVLVAYDEQLAEIPAADIEVQLKQLFKKAGLGSKTGHSTSQTTAEHDIVKAKE